MQKNNHKNKYYCQKCDKVFIYDNSGDYKCPHCGSENVLFYGVEKEIISTFTIELIREIVNELINRSTFESKLILRDGTEITTDTGYAADGCNALIKELELVQEEEILNGQKEE